VDPAVWQAADDDGTPRPEVRIRMLFSGLIFLGFLFGAFAAVLLSVSAQLLGAPGTAVDAVAAIGIAVLWVPLWLGTSIRFTADELGITRMARWEWWIGHVGAVHRAYSHNTP